MKIRDSKDLIAEMTRPGDALVSFVRTLSGPLVVLGAGGKMGPTLCILAKRAIDQAGVDVEVVAVSRFSDRNVVGELARYGIRVVSADLLESSDLAKLPDSENVVYLVGMKFGTSSNPERTWALNTLVPAAVCNRYASARIVALSTGNVYPFVNVRGGGSVERDPLDPVGEYGTACMARERLFGYFSKKNGTAVALIRLNYAIDLRYGVFLDLAQKVVRGEEIDLTTGYFNVIWQGEANDRIIRALDLTSSPAAAWNLTGTASLSVRAIATALATRLDREPVFVGTESERALLSNATALASRLGNPDISVDQMLDWTAEWVRTNQPTWNKPTHFEERSGSF